MTPQSANQTPFGKLVPFRWPSAWNDPALLNLLTGSPINCLLLESLDSAKPVADRARSAGLTVLEWSALGPAPLASVKWDSAAHPTAITGLAWPRINLSAGRTSEATAGPTGAPWIDSNAWVARLAAVRAPHRPVWLGFELAKDDPVPTESSYTIAIADSAAAGAQWMVWLDDGLRKSLPGGNENARKVWRSILATLSFFEKHRNLTSWEPSGPLGILSSFAGTDEFMGQEVLNLASRRNLLYRVLDRSVPASHRFESLKAVLYVDSGKPSAELKTEMEAFVRAGGLLIVPHTLASEFPRSKSVECPVAGYELRPLGKGAVAAATRDWEDPYFLAADVHNLVRRRNDPVTIFNGRSLWEHFSVAPGGNRALLQLVAFSGRSNESVSMVLSRRWRLAALYTLGAESPAVLQPVQVDGRPEFHLPAFSYYAALEFES